MRRLLMIAVTVVLAAGVAYAQGPFGWGSLAGQFWGTWAHQVQLAPGMNLPALITLNVDNTVVGVSGLMFGGMPGALNTYGPVQGVWQVTGRSSIGATTLIFLFDSATGVLTGYQRNRCSLNYSADFSSYTGKEFVETTICASPIGCPDPLSPDTIWTPLPGMPPDGYSVSGTRVIRIPAGPLQS